MEKIILGPYYLDKKSFTQFIHWPLDLESGVEPCFPGNMTSTFDDDNHPDDNYDKSSMNN